MSGYVNTSDDDCKNLELTLWLNENADSNSILNTYINVLNENIYQQRSSDILNWLNNVSNQNIYQQGSSNPTTSGPPQSFLNEETTREAPETTYATLQNRGSDHNIASFENVHQQLYQSYSSPATPAQTLQQQPMENRGSDCNIASFGNMHQQPYGSYSNPATPAQTLQQQPMEIRRSDHNIGSLGNMHQQPYCTYSNPATPAPPIQQQPMENGIHIAPLGYMDQQPYVVNSNRGIDSNIASFGNMPQQPLHVYSIPSTSAAPQTVTTANRNQMLQGPTQCSKPAFPKMRPGPPNTTVFSGKHNFLVELDKNIKQKSFYGGILYMKPEKKFSLSFEYDNVKGSPLFTRLCVCFENGVDANTCVETCPLHNKIKDSTLPSATKWHNVLHSASDEDDGHVFYDGNKQTNTWYSTIVKFDSNVESNERSHAYIFICRNTCAKGIDRRPIKIVATLEDEQGEVLGRQIIHVQVCMHPRRDINDKIELNGANTAKSVPPVQRSRNKKMNVKAAGRNRRPAPNRTIATRSRTMINKIQIVKIPPLEVVGGNVAALGLNSLIDGMEILKTSGSCTPIALSIINKRIKKLKNILSSITKDRT